jgi:hypothetical protein
MLEGKGEREKNNCYGRRTEHCYGKDEARK